MKKQLFLFSALTLVSYLGFAQDITVTHTFLPGEPAIADDVNQNFTDVVTGVNNNNTAIDTRVTTIESSVTPTSEFSGFTMPFAASGQPHNIIVQRRNNDDGTFSYRVRTRYENTDSETVSINGVDTVFNYLAGYGTVNTLSDGSTITSLNKTVEAMNNTNYINFSRSSISYDPSDLSPTLSSISSERTWTFLGQGAIKHLIKEIVQYDSAVESNSSELELRTYTLGTGYQANGIDFGTTPFRVEHRQPGNSSSTGLSRLRIQGVGEVERFGSGSSPSYKVIYYSVDGQSGGSLSGTPFESGSAVNNLLF